MTSFSNIYPALLLIMVLLAVCNVAGTETEFGALDTRAKELGITLGPIYTELPPSFKTAATPWLDSKEHNGIAYFLFESAARIERYNMDSETWLATITLSNTPTAFTVDAGGIYIGYGTQIYRRNLDGSGETHLRNVGSDSQTLFTMSNYLYIHYGDDWLVSCNKSTGALIDSKEYFYEMTGISVAPTVGKAFARSTGVSPADILEIVLNIDGTLGNQDDSPYHGDYPGANETYVFPTGAQVADNAGIIYNTADLTYYNSLAGAFDDLAFYGNQPVLIRGTTLIAYSESFGETGRYTPTEPPLELCVRGTNVFSFFSSSPRGVDAEKIAISQFAPPQPGPPVNPSDLAYTPDSILLDKNEVVCLLSKTNLSVFRWAVVGHHYIGTIPLVEAPEFMAYSPETHRLYLAYPLGKINQINLDSTIAETFLVNSPQGPLGLATAGQYIFVCDPSGAWVSHFTYDPAGNLVDQEDWNYRSDEYVWSATNEKMYFFRDDTTPNDLLWEDIDTGTGLIGTKMDSPLHSSSGFIHPIRVSPDGSIVVLTSGRIHDAITLNIADYLANEITDAAWANDSLFTIRTYSSNTQIQKWTSGYSVEKTYLLDGLPLRIFSIRIGLLVITNLSGQPTFYILDTELNPAMQTRSSWQLYP